MQKEIQVVALDLDGTLLNKEQEVSSYNKRVLKELEAQGVEVIICTGRPYIAMEQFYKELQLSSPMICFNGAKIVDSRGESLLHTTIEESIGKRLIEIGEEEDVFCHGFIDNQWLIKEENDTTRAYSGKSGITPTLVNFQDLTPLNFTKMMYIDDSEKLKRVDARLTAELGDRIYKAFSWNTYLEVMNKESSKARALEFYLQSKGLSHKNLLAMGDGWNDMEMIQFAGIGVVMENGEKALKEHATYIAPHHDDNGVGRFLEEFFELA